MSLCDSCFAPGQCCKSLSLCTGDWKPITTWAGEGEAEKQMAEYGLPFVPIGEVSGRWTVTDQTRDDVGREYVEHRWACPKLSPDGRCGDYENRPDLCRRFEAGVHNRLCVHYMGAEGGDPTFDGVA